MRQQRDIPPEWADRMVKLGFHHNGKASARQLGAATDLTGCSRHGYDDGYMRVRKDGYTVWTCRPCARQRLTKWRTRQAA